MSLATFEDTPNLGMHRYPSAALLAATRSNLIALDRVTRQGRPAYCGGFGHPQELVTLNPYRESWGGFRAVPGLTTLTVETYAASVAASDVLRAYVNGAQVASWTLANGAQVHTAGLSAYPTNSAPDVVFEIYNPNKPANGASWGTFEVTDAYVNPVGLADAYPGQPTFAASYNATDLTQLANAVDWLCRRVALRTEPLFQTVLRWNGPYTGQTTVRWYGGVTVSPAAPTLTASGYVWVQHGGAAEQIRLQLNGATVASFTVPGAVGEYAWTLQHTLTQAAGTRVAVAVDMIRTAAPPAGDNAISRWTLQRVDLTGAASIYPAISIPVVPARQKVTWATLKAALNACSNAAATIKARIDANPDLWSRQRLYRRRYAFDDYQTTVYEPGQIAQQIARRGEAVLVKAKGASIEWGPGGFINGEQNEVGLYAVKNQFSQAAAQGDAVTTELVYLDTLGSLYPSAPYNVRGESVAYAGEILLVQLNA